jgi:signal transduction histidine kinase/CheY-like chemotaxis protein
MHVKPMSNHWMHGSDSDPSTPAHSLQDIRQEAFSQAVFPAALSLWLLVAGTFWLQGSGCFRLVVVGMVSVVIGIIACRLAEHHYTLAAYLFASTFLLTNEVGVRPLAPMTAQYVYPLIVVVAMALLGPAAGGIATAIGLGIILIHAIPLEPGQAMLTLLGPAWVTVTAALVAWQGYMALSTAVSWAWESYEQARRRTEEVQARRGELLQLSRNLEQANVRLQRLNYHLQIARREADEARQMKAQFAANISHELRTPLNLIVGFGQMLLTAPEFYGNTGTSPAYAADIMAIYRNARHLLHLVDDVLDLSQLETGTMTIQPEVAQLNETAHEALETTRGLFERRNLTVTLRLTPELPTLAFDRTRIRQVFINLLANAARYTDQGGVTVTTGRKGDTIYAEVRDTGIGISPDDLPRVFRPFSQLDTAASRQSEGVGLGLAISRHFVELHGGRITVESTPSVGSTFTFYLPLVEAEREEPTDLVRISSHRPTPPREKPDVVLVEQDPAVVRLFRRQLQDFCVIAATSWAAVTRIAGRRTPLAVVVDSAEVGPAEAHAQQERLGPAPLPVVGCPMPSGRRLARAEGMDSLLIKPILREHLMEALGMPLPMGTVVLVADSDPDMARLLERMIRSGSETSVIVKAYEPGELLALASIHQPSVLLVDVTLLEDTTELNLTRLRAMCANPSATIVGTSDRAYTEALVASPQRCFYVVTEEPLQPVATVRQVRRLLDTLAPEPS